MRRFQFGPIGNGNRSWVVGVRTIVLFSIVAVASHFAGIALMDQTAHAQGCFNNPACWRNTVGWPRERTKTNTISWDMDSSSYSTEWAWKGTAPNVNFEDAANHSAFEWTKGNLTWDQRDSCSQARGTGNGVVCIGMRNWCKWLGSFGLPGLTTVFGVAKSKRRSDCDLPAGWFCRGESSIRLNGFAFWKEAGCGLGTINVSALTPKNPDPNDNGDPRLKDKCKSRALPNLSTQPNAKHVSVHEFGHGIQFYDIHQSCVPVDSVMEQYWECELLVSCPTMFTTANDDYAVKFLYGP